jgi:DNA-binding transcriptional regulator/RsmH inhibitor MraZ
MKTQNEPSDVQIIELLKGKGKFITSPGSPSSILFDAEDPAFDEAEKAINDQLAALELENARLRVAGINAFERFHKTISKSGNYNFTKHQVMSEISFHQALFQNDEATQAPAPTPSAIARVVQAAVVLAGHPEYEHLWELQEAVEAMQAGEVA